MEDSPFRFYLSPTQRAALTHVEARARESEPHSLRRIADAIQRTRCLFDEYERAMACVREHARVVVHFHPDRMDVRRKPVAAALLEEGVYRNQFETGLSSGSTSAFAGGARDIWERSLFGGAYHAEGVSTSERPKYGALEVFRYSDGPIPRFGSCYFVLGPKVTVRSSFTFMGSEDPRALERVGTISRLHSVMSALIDEILGGGMATPAWPPFTAPTLGVPRITVPFLLSELQNLALPRDDPAKAEAGRVLDSQIEAQVHGVIDLYSDVELLVADPAFVETEVGVTLGQVASKYAFPLRWHRGFSLATRDVPDDFRGPEMPRLAQRIAGTDGIIDAAVIGRAAASLYEDPQAWRDWGTHAEALQHLKQLWHVLVHYGRRGARAPMDMQTRSARQDRS